MDPFFTVYPRTLNYVMAAVAGWAFVCCWMRRGSPFRQIPAAVWLLYSLLIMSALSYFWSMDKEGTQEVVVGFAPYLLIDAFFVPLCIRDWKDVRSAAYWILYFGFPVAMLLLATTGVNRFGREIELTEELVDRYGRVHKGGNALTVASFGGALMIVSIFLRTQGIRRVLEIVRWGVVAVGLVLIVRSGSRGQFGAVVIVTGLAFLISVLMGGRASRAMLTVLAGGFFALLIPWAMQFSMIQGRFDISSWTSDFSQTRLQMCADVLEYWIESGQPWNWIIGLGNSASWSIISAYPHVVPVEILVELGVVGFVIYTAVVLLAIHSAFRLMWRLRKMPLEQSYVLTFFALWAFFALLTLKQGSFLMSFSWMSFTVILARLEPIMQRSLAAQRIRAVRQSMRRSIQPRPAELPVAAPL
jgi:hypothetical protein